MAYPGAFRDIYGNINDTLKLNFNSRESGYYGTLYLNITGVNRPVVVQLLDMRDRYIREAYLEENKRVKFDYLKPDKYRLKIIHDVNGNRKWDTGDYLKGIQPERVEYYQGEINVRSNWELEIKPVVGKEK
jgi:hypothetical protein